MKLPRPLVLMLVTQVVAVAMAFGQGSYKAQAIGAAPADVPEALQGVLDSQGARVVNDKGTALCEVWLRKTIPTSSAPSTSPDFLYGNLKEGTFLGVVHFPDAAMDFRGQAIKAGFYTLRYALIPQDGNHMGVNPTRDAIVLGPVSVDQSPDKVLTTDDLIKLGRQVSGTAHPGFLVASQVTGGDFPGVTKDDQNHWNLEVKGRGQSGDLPLAITVVGKWQG